MTGTNGLIEPWILSELVDQALVRTMAASSSFNRGNTFLERGLVALCSRSLDGMYIWFSSQDE